MRNAIITILMFTSVFGLSAQGCLPYGINFINQNQIDSFQINYPGCTEIDGDVIINLVSDISNLNGLHGVKKIGGDLSISGYMSSGPISFTLAGLDLLDTIGGSFFLDELPLSSDLSGLENLTYVGGIVYIRNNIFLESLNGLDKLEHIGGGLTITNNDALETLTQETTIKTLIGDLLLSYNYSLESLSGLDSINSALIRNLYIFENTVLNHCEINSICEYVGGAYGTINIHDNGSDCDSPVVVANKCGQQLNCLPLGNYHVNSQNDVDSFQLNYSGCKDLSGSLIITDSFSNSDDINNLNGLDSITTVEHSLIIRFNQNLLSLNGLEQIHEVGALSLNDNYNLSNLDGLSGLNTIENTLSLQYNTVLSDISELADVNVDSVTRLRMYGNFMLSACNINSVCNILELPNEVYIRIEDNASGCNSQAEVEEACETGIDEYLRNDELIVYPNPSNGIVYFKGNGLSDIKYVNIYNQLGQKVSYKNKVANSIDVSSLQKGLYLIEIITETVTYRKELVVN